MFISLIPISILVASVGGMVYIASGHLSEINGDDGKRDEFSFNLRARFSDWVGQLPLGNVKIQSLSFTQKTLHRMRLFLLKSDNFLMKLIEKISQRKESISGDKTGGGVSDFWGDFSEKQIEEKIVQPPAEPVVKISLAASDGPNEKVFDVKPIKKTLKTKKSGK